MDPDPVRQLAEDRGEPSGAAISATRDPARMPSLRGSGVPEFPAAGAFITLPAPRPRQ